MHLIEHLNRFARCESGLSMVEYALILFIGMAVAAGITHVGEVMARLYDNLKIVE